MREFERSLAPNSGALVFTVFTPTYNRAETLPRVFRSLRDQTFRDFEWLVVDDGSEDETSDLIQRWKEEAEFPIQLYRQENQGKHIAHNRAVERARGRLFLPLDSDDECDPEALDTLYSHWRQIAEARRDQFSGVTGLCVDPEGKVVGDVFPEDVFDSDALEIYYRYGIRGEKWGFQRTDLLRRYLFPEDLTRTYVPESVVWSALARDGYRTRFVNQTLRIYHPAETEADARVKLMGRSAAANAPGEALRYQQVLNRDLGWFFYAPVELYLSGARYVRFSLHCRRGFLAQFRQLNSVAADSLWLAALPVGTLMYLADCLREASK